MTFIMKLQVLSCTISGNYIFYYGATEYHTCNTKCSKLPEYITVHKICKFEYHCKMIYTPILKTTP